MRFTRSVRWRITAVATVGAAVTLGALALGLVRYHADRQIENVDEQLRLSARVSERVIAAPGPIPDLGPTGVVVQVVTEDAHLIGSNEDGEGYGPLVDASFPRDTGGTALTVRHPELGRMRLWVTPLGSTFWLVTARPIDQLDQSVQSLQAALLVVVPVLTLALAVLIGFVVGRSLRPVEAIRSAASEITDRDLSQRVAVSGTGDEVDRLATTMNEMLGRLERAAERERRLVADASHELRNPLAAAQALIESRPADPAEGRLHDSMALEALRRLRGLVDQLLELARHEMPRPAVGRTVDLDELVLLHADVLRRTSDLTVDTSAVSGGRVLGSEEALGRVVENLASNAGRHARSRVGFAVRERDDRVELTVTDDGRGIPAEERRVVFERFTRLDDPRANDHAGAGLGLAIVARIVERHGGQVDATDGPDEAGTTMTVVLPAHRDGDGG